MSACDRLISLAKFATSVGLKARSCSYSVEVSHRSDGAVSLAVAVHNPPEDFLKDIIERGATNDGWRDCSGTGGSETNVFRSWEFSPEESLKFTVYERPPEGVLLKDLPYEETREYLLAREAEDS
jgi:hypothetical protein